VLSSFVCYNGHSIGDVSRKYPTILTPPAWMFSIWAVIYMAVGAFCVWQMALPKTAYPVVRSIGPWMIMASVFQFLWVPAWAYEQFGLSLLLMFGIFTSLLVANLRLAQKYPMGSLTQVQQQQQQQQTSEAEKKGQRPSEAFSDLKKASGGAASTPTTIRKTDLFTNMLVRLPFSLWFGWITFALVAELTATMRYSLSPSNVMPPLRDFGANIYSESKDTLGLDDSSTALFGAEFFDSPLWAGIALSTVLLFALAWGMHTGDWIYPIPVAWGALGLFLKHGGSNGVVGTMGLVVASTLFAYSAINGYELRKSTAVTQTAHRE